MTELEKVQIFFALDTKIKEEMLNFLPRVKNDFYKEDFDKIYDYLKEIKDNIDKLYESFKMIVSVSNFQDYNIDKVFNNIYREYQKVLNFSNTQSFDEVVLSINKLYKDNIASLNKEFVDNVNKNICSYSLYSDMKIYDLISEVKTLNELLHLMHHYLINDINVYQKLGVLEEQSLSNGDTINMVGINNEKSKYLFDILKNNSKIGDTYILSVDNNTIYINIRNIGHATIMELNYYEDKVLINYFFPKTKMSGDFENYYEKLYKDFPGLDKIKEGYAKGSIEVPINKLNETLNNLIDKIPNDSELCEISVNNNVICK